MKVPMKIDITTGDKITPSAVIYSYPLMFEERQIDIMIYTLETILAEKYETIIRRNIANTRARDYYDIHMLCKSYKDNIRIDVLKDAVKATATKRGSLEELKDYNEIVEEIMESEFLQNLWTGYCRDNPYVEGLTINEVMKTLKELGERLGIEEVI